MKFSPRVCGTRLQLSSTVGMGSSVPYFLFPFTFLKILSARLTFSVLLWLFHWPVYLQSFVYQVQPVCHKLTGNAGHGDRASLRNKIQENKEIQTSSELAGKSQPMLWFFQHPEPALTLRDTKSSNAF